jgi:Thaumatin family
MIFVTQGRRSRQLTVLVACGAAAALLAACSSPGGTAAEPSQAASAAAAQAAARSTAPAHVTARSRPVASPLRAPAASALGARRVTFVNRVRPTIWVAAEQNPAHPLAVTGWVLPPGHRVTITVPDRWNGRFWGRTGCVFHHGVGHCQTGDCAGRFRCAGNGAIPTLRHRCRPGRGQAGPRPVGARDRPAAGARPGAAVGTPLAAALTAAPPPRAARRRTRVASSLVAVTTGVTI